MTPKTQSALFEPFPPQKPRSRNVVNEPVDHADEMPRRERHMSIPLAYHSTKATRAQKLCNWSFALRPFSANASQSTLPILAPAMRAPLELFHVLWRHPPMPQDVNAQSSATRHQEPSYGCVPPHFRRRDRALDPSDKLARPHSHRQSLTSSRLLLMVFAHASPNTSTILGGTFLNEGMNSRASWRDHRVELRRRFARDHGQFARDHGKVRFAIPVQLVICLRVGSH